jgi:predicted outer membrane protein
LEHTHQDRIEALRPKSGEDFDRAFITHQVTMHQQALKLLDDMADSTNDLNLQVYIKQARPELLFHLTEAQRLQRQLAVKLVQQ